MEPTDLTYRIDNYNGKIFQGVAWNANEFVISTYKFKTYTEAKNHLQTLAKEYQCNLKWFDGEHEY